MIWNNRLNRIARIIGPACVFAVVFAAISIWMGKPSLPTTGAILAAGAMIGVARAATVKLTAVSSAVWIDERLNLHDLLATAWTLRDSHQPWDQTIVAMAEARCREISPADAMPQLQGGRTWSAIALGAALAVSLGLIEPMNSRIAASPQADALTMFHSSSFPNAVGSLLEPSRPAGDASLDEPSNRAGGNNPTTADERSGKTGSAGDGSISGSQSGVASGLSRTATQIQPLPTQAETNGSINASPRGTLAGGGGGLSPNVERSATASGIGNQSPSTTVPPWQSSAWPAAQSAAIQSIQSGSIDPAYQNIVRDYFSRP